MKHYIRILLVTVALGLLWLGVGSTNAQEPVSGIDLSGEPPTQQIIIKFKPASDVGQMSPAQRENRMQTLTNRAGVQLSYFRAMSDEAHVIRLPERLPLEEVQAIAAKLAADPGVQYAEADAILRPVLVPNDTRYNEQTHYQAVVPNGNYGANLPAAWDITTGDPNLVVAVIDTGDRSNHPDLAGRSVPGYDFISSVAAANDGDGRDNDPDDPGDWVALNECPQSPEAANSSWHGAHVGGTIGAASNNGQGVAGVNWQSKLIHGRALGKCGGSTSDIVDAMAWTGGIAVTGVPANPNPARVLNLSLGGGGACTTAQQNVIDALVAKNVVVVVAAGNENVNVSNSSPANCNNVITVAANAPDGNRASYSNFGTLVEISAPGGDQDTGQAGVLSTVDTGTQGPVGAGYAFFQGTSMATPHVAGIVSLMLSVDPTLTPAQVLSIIQTTVTPFPAGSTCNTTICGTGIINAAAAVAKAATPKNDAFANATDVTGGLASTAVNLAGTTLFETGEPTCDFFGAQNDTPSVWYKVTPAQAGQLTVNVTPGAGVDPTLGLFTGSAVNALTLVGACQDVDGPDVAENITNQALTANTTYYIRVAAINTSSGSVNVQVTCTGCGASEIQVLDGATDIADNTGSVNFGTTSVNTPVTKVFTVKNTGTANLTLSGLTAPTGFSIAANFASTTVAANGQTTFSLKLDATAAGTPNGAVSFTTNDADENPFNFTVNGTVSSGVNIFLPLIIK